MDPQRLARARGVLTGALLLVAMSSAWADSPLAVSFEVSATSDDNVSRGYGSGNIFPDQFTSGGLGLSWRFPLSTHTRFTVLGFAGFDSYYHYTGLSHTYAGAQGIFQYRPSGQFFAPTYSISLRTAAEEYFSRLRDGYRHDASLAVRKPLTDQLQLQGSLGYILRDGASAVFDTRETTARVSTDLAITARDNVYLGLEYRAGDIVSVGQPSTAFLDLATAAVQDDVFTDTTRYAYRIDARVTILSLGYNRALGPGSSLDFSGRWIVADPSPPSGASAAARQVRYNVNQFTLAWLLRF